MMSSSVPTPTKLTSLASSSSSGASALSSTAGASAYGTLRRVRKDSTAAGQPSSPLAQDHLTVREKIDQAVGLAYWFNLMLQKNATSIDLSARVKNLKELNKEPVNIPTIFSKKYSVKDEALILKVEIHPQEISEMMEIIQDTEISDEVAKKRLDGFIDLLVRSLADINTSGVELKKLRMPETVGILNKPIAKDLRDVLTRAIELKKLFVRIPEKQGHSKRDRLIKYSIATGVLCAHVRVEFFSSIGIDSQPVLDPSLKNLPLPKHVDISLLWDKRNGDKIGIVIDGICVYLYELKDSTDLNKSTLRHLIKNQIIEAGSVINSQSAKKATWDNQAILECFRRVCGESIFKEAQERKAYHAQTLERYSNMAGRPRAKSMEIPKTQADTIDANTKS